MVWPRRSRVHGCCGALLALAALLAPSSVCAQAPAPADALATSITAYLAEPLRTSVPETWVTAARWACA